MKTLAFCLLVSAASVATCVAQEIGLGLKGGTRTEQEIRDGAPRISGEPNYFVIGPFVELLFGHGLAVEFDVLYSRIGYNDDFPGLALPGAQFPASRTELRGRSLEFPILVKKQFDLIQAKPYVEFGPSFREARGSFRSLTIPDRQESASTWRPESPMIGFVVGGGLEVGAGRIMLIPEVRYTRWHTPLVESFGPRGFSLTAARNQVHILIGGSWRSRIR
jgi:hypothetical protein